MLPDFFMGISVDHLIWGAGITVLFAVLAWALRGVSISGAIAGGVVSFLIFVLVGRAAFVGLVLLFFLTWAATRFGYQRKQRLGTAEKKSGRTASQVIANLGIAALCAVAYYFNHGDIKFVLALSAALAEVAADTVSSELGQAFSNTAYLITTWKRVPAGTDGGVTLAGTLAGSGAAIAISLWFVLAEHLPWKALPISVMAAIFAMFADSILGAALERRGTLSNNAVNFLGTLIASILAILAVII
jgi:uncharacterized protein (TIGR00297 family)